MGSFKQKFVLPEILEKKKKQSSSVDGEKHGS